MCTSRPHPGVLAVGVALLVVAVTDLQPSPHGSRDELFALTMRIAALITALGVAPALAQRIPRHTHLVRAVGAGLAALLAVDLAAAYQTHFEGGAVSPSRGVALLAIAALVLVVPLLTFIVSRTPEVPVASTAVPAALRRIAVALCGLAGSALVGAALLKLGLDAQLHRSEAAVALVVLIAAPACLFVLLLLVGLQRLGRAGGWALGAAILFTGALTIEALQAIGYYRGWVTMHSESYVGWLGGASVVGPLLGAAGLVALARFCGTEVHRRQPRENPGYDVVAFGAFAMGISSLGLLVARPHLTSGMEQPALAALAVVIPWIIPLVAVPLLRRTAQLLEEEPSPAVASLSRFRP